MRNRDAEALMRELLVIGGSLAVLVIALIVDAMLRVAQGPDRPDNDQYVA